MKTIQRRIMLLCSSMLLLCTGCISVDDPQTKLLQYMENRYPDDNFTWIHNVVGGEGKNTFETFEIIMESEKFPDAEIHAARWKSNGEFIYADNYMAYYLEDDVNAYMHEIAEDCFGECKVYVHFSYGKMASSAFPTNATAEDYLKSKPSCIFAIYLPPDGITKEEAKDGLEKLESEYETQQFETVEAAVYILPDAESYKITDSFYGSTGSLNDLKYYEFIGTISSDK